MTQREEELQEVLKLLMCDITADGPIGCACGICGRCLAFQVLGPNHIRDTRKDILDRLTGAARERLTAFPDTAKDISELISKDLRETLKRFEGQKVGHSTLSEIKREVLRVLSKKADDAFVVDDHFDITFFPDSGSISVVAKTEYAKKIIAPWVSR